ncbi:APH(3'') family aminoglycoside O-phosphotransferase [Phreatobacter stygius]|uniref:Aminoglycoside 3'-phosphotransferase n=2 Tax=Phreatobacter stygius TaxID=1940610 RepID=A0A4D7BFL4_9HYPH|nr:APH(3'') family aminoglycoside O-phosphotransferase [Phreatobacter stygius]QCI69415.1 APH(3'') family aminoglycoside O-phosphotransferase [Phreatobacter stygius]
MHETARSDDDFNEDLLPDLPAGRTWVPVGSGESGDKVYCRSDGVAYAKLSQGLGAARLDGERRRTEWLAATGLGSLTVLDWRMSDSGACLVTRTVPGVSASELSASALSAAWPSIARQIKALHDLPVADCPFERGLSTMVDRAADVVGRGAVNPDFLDPDQRAIPAAVLLARLQADMPRRLAQEAGDLVVCHGDACLPNVMVDPDTYRCTGLIDLGRLGTADRYVDLALLLANARESWTSPGDAPAARARLFDIHAIAQPDQERLDFYLRLDPLTWG